MAPNTLPPGTTHADIDERFGPPDPEPDNPDAHECPDCGSVIEFHGDEHDDFCPNRRRPPEEWRAAGEL